MRERIQRKTLSTLKSSSAKKAILFLVGLELIFIISNKASELPAPTTLPDTYKKETVKKTAGGETDIITKALITTLEKSSAQAIEKKEFQVNFISSLKDQFWFDGSKKRIEEKQETITQIETIFNIFQNNKKSSFHSIQLPHLFASAMEESRFGTKDSYRNQVGVYQIMPIAIADIDKRYEIYTPLITPEIAAIFGFEKEIPQSFFNSLYCGTDSTYDYTQAGREVLTCPEKNIALGLLYYLSLEKQISQGHLVGHRKNVLNELDSYGKDTGVSESFLNQIERYVKAKGLTYNEDKVLQLFQLLENDKEAQRLFVIFSRFNGHPDNKIHYGFKILLYADIFETAFSQATELQENNRKEPFEAKIVNYLFENTKAFFQKTETIKPTN